MPIVQSSEISNILSMRKKVFATKNCFYFLFDFYSFQGTTHCAAWSGFLPLPRSNTQLQIGTPTSIPLHYKSLRDVEVELIRDRFNVLWNFSDMVSQTWKLMSLSRSEVGLKVF